MKQLFSLALVSGASSGIGQSLCRLLAKQGINLLISGRDEEKLSQLRNELSKLVSVRMIAADLIDKDQCQKLISCIHQEVPDLVINSAGFGLYGDCLTYKTQDQLDVLELNAKVLLEICLETARTLVSVGKKGTIINISSAIAYQVAPGMSVYAATKSFVNQFSQAFDLEMQPYGINILSICPGMVQTHFQARAGGMNNSEKIGIMTPDFVAEEIWKQIQSKTSVKIVDWRYRFLTYLSKFFPTNWVAKLVKKNILNRIPPRTIIKNDP